MYAYTLMISSIYVLHICADIYLTIYIYTHACGCAGISVQHSALLEYLRISLGNLVTTHFLS